MLKQLPVSKVKVGMSQSLDLFSVYGKVGQIQKILSQEIQQVTRVDVLKIKFP